MFRSCTSWLRERAWTPTAPAPPRPARSRPPVRASGIACGSALLRPLLASSFAIRPTPGRGGRLVPAGPDRRQAWTTLVMASDVTATGKRDGDRAEAAGPVGLVRVSLCVPRSAPGTGPFLPEALTYPALPTVDRKS